MDDAKNNLDDLIGASLAKYFARFGNDPPLLYLAAMSESDAVVRINSAIAAGHEITDDDFAGNADEHTTVS